MKKLTYFSALALGLVLAACDNYKEPNPPAQYNPQEPVIETGNVEATSLIGTSTYDLEALAQANQMINIAEVAIEDMPEGYTIGALAYISRNNFSTSVDVPATIEEIGKEDGVTYYNISVSPDDLGAQYQTFTQNPSEKTIQIAALLTASIDGQIGYIGGPNKYYGMADITILPFPTNYVVEEAYYLIGTIDDWSVVGAIKFNHSDVDVYDDPVFSIKIDITEEQAAAGWWWKIIPQSTYDLGDWSQEDNSQYGPATNGDTAAEGKLVPRKDGVDPGAGDFQEAGPYLLTINMEELTYAFTLAIDQLYTPGDSNGWSQEASQILTTEDYQNYYGYAYLSGSFKFSSQPDWNGINYGSTGVEGELSTDGGAGNLTVATPGLYWCDVNPVSLTYSLTLVESYGIVGSATPGSWDSSTPLTPSDDYLTWTGTVTLTDGAFKFRANDKWDVNLGGELDNLTAGGPDINWTEPGTYVVTLNLGAVPYTATLVKK